MEVVFSPPIDLYTTLVALARSFLLVLFTPKNNIIIILFGRWRISTEEKVKVCLGNRIDSIPCCASRFCTRTIWKRGWIAPGWFEEKDEFVIIFRIFLVQNSWRGKELNKLCPPKQQRQPVPFILSSCNSSPASLRLLVVRVNCLRKLAAVLTRSWRMLTRLVRQVAGWQVVLVTLVACRSACTQHIHN